MSALVLILTLFFAPAPSGPLTMAAGTQKKILVVRIGGVDVKKYDIAVGSKKHPTPMGRFTVRHIIWNPAWHPPDKPWAKGKSATPPGHPKNPMKVVKVFFQEPDYYIHGTDDEESIGEAASHGCLRMRVTDAYDLARFLMMHAGAAKNGAWFDQVIGLGKTADVTLPQGVPFAIGK
ncbi:MAG TPA: L,D-transpeptidase [Thermoanaerobaculia bacterium]